MAAQEGWNFQLFVQRIVMSRITRGLRARRGRGREIVFLEAIGGRRRLFDARFGLLPAEQREAAILAALGLHIIGEARALLFAFTVLVCSLPVRASSALDASARKSAEVAEELQHTGCCDASAAAAIGDNFFVVASDEDSVLRVYSRAADGSPVATFNLRPHLNLGRSSAETDIEGAARLGDLVFWITSHAR
nr:hypothetical protein [Terricaulis sp.]